MTTSRDTLLQLMDAALKAADPAVQIPRNLPTKPKGKTIVIGAGKASANMAQAFENAWDGDMTGLVVTRYGHAVPCEKIEIVEASHPVPDAAGQKAAQRILDIVKSAGPDDLVVCMISGGGSALLALPGPGLTLEDKQAISKALLHSGATISEMNCVRKHLSAIKGGRLAAACAPARMVTYLVSDVPGDDPAIIASGPTVADPTTGQDALDIIRRYRIEIPLAATELLNNDIHETVKPGDKCFDGHEVIMLSRPQDSLEAAAKVARDLGINPVILGDAIEGEAREVAIVHAGIAHQVANHGQPAARPCVLLSGGETTVTVRAKGGRGGRNSEFLLSLLIQFRDHEGFSALAIDTDGIDGSEDNAGAIIDPTSWQKAISAGVDLREYLANNDAYSAFAKIDDLLITGPTLTNVNDFRAILIE
ncbi:MULTISPECIES: glycerate kinase [Thalassospira]|uniref:glycerate kinase type-2 family protein n=1 Tax=Thalassospira TaxID=168934 RepID=UPI0008DDBF9C|nr:MULTISPECIES: glycerate kinase [Thalassospira]MAB34247.1 glycerate kinase [Thalassospira sp.]MDM7978233.1 glycerate kinase [Thalassospira xiamenensis]OHZ03381.1 hydroxypyruvate reductase [Thalassospira sp. MIT1004]HBS24247.1 glycerate kinase [Thalassospira sp.]